MSIMDHFKTQTPPAPATSTVAPAPATSATSANPTAPVTPPDPTVAPLEPYSKMWENDPNFKPPGNEPIFAPTDPKKLMEAAKSVDFTALIPQETMQKIAQGGQEGQVALQEALRATAAHVYAQNAHATTEIVKQALAKQEQNLLAKLPGYLRQNKVTEDLHALNPALAHPAMKPVVETVQKQMQVKYPNATPAEITQQVSKYFDAIATISAKGRQDASSGAQSSGEDWEKFLTS